ncbi:MAG: hypothetical protein C7B46_05020 [Sulfobacillus benefaciens]|uniref:Uncharacterized protein n=1 Tax=Sulfobacillus benefaciens TaxID=453960 RepID=A0A2T2XJ36_9FIRM|nr:MAG: hypothetical protein C7B46_05020 [Sulfobacillus benefaciens]
MGYVVFLGGQGTSPLILCLNLTVLPIAPLLYVLLGSRLSEIERGGRARWISGAWPVRPGVRAAGQVVALLAISLSGAVITLLCTLWHVDAGFWTSRSWPLYTARDGVSILFLGNLLMLSFGYLWGQWIFSIWKSVIALLIPILAAVATVAIRPPTWWYSGWAPLFQISPFSWFTDTLSPVWGFGPFERDLTLIAGWAILLILAWWVSTWAGISRTGLSKILAGFIVTAVIAMSLPLGHELWQETQGITQNQVIAWAHHGPKAPVAITASHILLSMEHGSGISGHGIFTMTSRGTVSHFPLFLNPELRITEVKVNRQSVVWQPAQQYGWIWVDHPLSKDQTVKVSLAWTGRLILWGEYHSTVSAFISPNGALLSTATWYPLTSIQKKETWQVHIRAPKGLVAVSGYGSFQGTGTLTGRGQGMNLALGHLAPTPFSGAVIYAGGDEVGQVLHALHRATALNRLMRDLGPPYPGVLVWNGAMEWEPPFVSLSRAAWPSDNLESPYPAGPGVGTALADNTVNQPVLQMASGLSRRLLNLWLTGGQSLVREGSMTHHLVSAMLTRYGLADNYRLGPLIGEVGGLSPAGFHWSAVRFRHLLQRGTLTRTQIDQVLKEARVRYP